MIAILGHFDDLGIIKIGGFFEKHLMINFWHKKHRCILI
jgi:hypothetical protein